MDIYIDYTTVIDLENDIGKYTGAGNYTRDVIRSLTDRGIRAKILVYKGFSPLKTCEKDLMCDEVVLVETQDLTDHVFSKGDILFLPAVTGRILKKAYRIKKKNAGLKIYAVIHDRQHNISAFDPMDRFFYEGILSFLPALYIRYLVKKLVYDCFYPLWIGSVDKVFTVSNHTMQALDHKSLKWITYLYQSTGYEGYDPGEGDGYDDMGDYILFVSGGRPEKNLGRALLAFRDLCRKTKTGSRLCITGIDREKLYRIAAHLKISRSFIDERVISYDYVDMKELGRLYKNCRYLLFVSKGEGFGLPVLEALQFEKTVLCSRQSAVPEVAGSIFYYVDAFNLSSIRDGMLYLNEEKNLRYREGLAAKKKKIANLQAELDRQVLADEICEE